MNEPQQPAPPEAMGGSLKDMATNFFDSLKGPVFWVAVGFVTCKFLDRKKGKIIG